MCEKRTRKIKKGSHLTRLREARRLQRLQRLATPASPVSPLSPEEAAPAPCPQMINKTAQNRVILELAWKTVALMHKNRLIQQKIIALQKETSEFIAAVMNHPENRKRYMEHMRLYGLRPEPEMQESESADDDALKMEPEA